MKPIPFQCNLDRMCEDERWVEDWSGLAEFVHQGKGYPLEIKIHARATTYHLVLGQYTYGYYLVLPLKDIGAGIAYPGDATWNTEHLIQAGIPPVDAYSIGAGLKALAPYLPD